MRNRCITDPAGLIALKGLNYGFIGGTCGLIGPDELLFAEGTSGSIPIICGSGNRRQSWEKDFSREYRESVRLWKHHSSERMQ